jgi:hypothetical protein
LDGREATAGRGKLAPAFETIAETLTQLRIAK